MHILMRKHEKWNIVEAMYDKRNIVNIYFVPRFKYIDVKTLQLFMTVKYIIIEK